MFQFQENFRADGQKDRQIDRLYFIGPLLLLSGVQKLKPQVFTQPPQQKHIYISTTLVYQKED